MVIMEKVVIPEVPLTKEEKQKLVKDAMEKKYPEQRWFRVGDLITINGIRFRIKNVKPTELRLKMLPKLRVDPVE
jgi:uncharacterized Zn finger protein